MASLRRKPREAFVYVLQAHRSLPEDEQPRFTIQPPSERAWAAMLDDSPGVNTTLTDAVIRHVLKLEGHADAEAFGAPDSPARRKYVDEVMGFEMIGELGRAIADTLLSETDRKN